jgi:hypothetical protein
MAIFIGLEIERSRVRLHTSISEKRYLTPITIFYFYSIPVRSAMMMYTLVLGPEQSLRVDLGWRYSLHQVNLPIPDGSFPLHCIAVGLAADRSDHLFCRCFLSHLDFSFVINGYESLHQSTSAICPSDSESPQPASQTNLI